MASFKEIFKLTDAPISKFSLKVISCVFVLTVLCYMSVRQDVSVDTVINNPIKVISMFLIISVVSLGLGAFWTTIICVFLAGLSVRGSGYKPTVNEEKAPTLNEEEMIEPHSKLNYPTRYISDKDILNVCKRYTNHWD